MRGRRPARFKIRVVCTNFPGVDNDYDSPACAWTQTLPLPSSQPAPPTLTTSRAWEIPSGNTYSYVNTFTIEWQPQHNPNQCRFKKWIVEWRLSPAGPFVDGGIWYEALCLPESVYTRNTLNSCELKGHISGGTSEVEALRGCGWWFEARSSNSRNPGDFQKNTIEVGSDRVPDISVWYYQKCFFIQCITRTETL